MMQFVKPAVAIEGRIISVIDCEALHNEHIEALRQKCHEQRDATESMISGISLCAKVEPKKEGEIVRREYTELPIGNAIDICAIVPEQKPKREERKIDFSQAMGMF